MSNFKISLLGRFTILCNGRELGCFQSQKVKELFSFLVLHHDKAHHRDVLAELLWGGNDIADSKKYLRKALWKLNSELKEMDCSLRENLQIEPQWVKLSMGGNITADVLMFEETYTELCSITSAELSPEQYQQLKNAKSLYRGDLLNGWYWDWCILDRERFREMLMQMIHKLMGYCEVHGDYEAGIGYGNEILNYDRARERTHRRLMRLYDLSGNRSVALRQFEQCRKALKEELDVAPSATTLALYERIASGKPGEDNNGSNQPAGSEGLEETLSQIRQIIDQNIQNQEQLLRRIRSLEEELHSS